MWRGERDFLDALPQQQVGGQALGRAARAIQAIDLAALAGVGAGRRVEHEIVAADAGRAWLDHTLPGAGGNCCVGGIAAALEELEGGDEMGRDSCWDIGCQYL